MLGEFCDEGDEMIEQARAQASEYQDEELLDIVEHYAAMRGEAAVSEEILEGAGLETGAKSHEPAEQRLGELFIQTSPVEALINVNGNPIGQSPLLLEKVPFSQLVIEAETGSMDGREEVTVSDGALQRITIQLQLKPGSLRINCDEQEISVYLGGRPMGAAGSGLFSDIVPGTHRAEPYNRCGGPSHPLRNH